MRAVRLLLRRGRRWCRGRRLRRRLRAQWGRRQRLQGSRDGLGRSSRLRGRATGGLSALCRRAGTHGARRRLGCGRGRRRMPPRRRRHWLRVASAVWPRCAGDRPRRTAASPRRGCPPPSSRACATGRAASCAARCGARPSRVAAPRVRSWARSSRSPARIRSRSCAAGRRHPRSRCPPPPPSCRARGPGPRSSAGSPIRCRSRRSPAGTSGRS